MGYLDYAGLQHLWDKLKEKFAPKSHSHDDRYYTESEMDGKLNSKSNTNHTHDASTLINALGAGTAAPTDPDYIITQWVGGGTSNTTWIRRPMSSIWSYIKSKADSVYQPKGSYAASGHTHDDRYYTESEMNTKLSKKAENIVLASDTNLNNITTPGFYSCGGGNKITNKPNNIDAIGLIVTHNASGNYYTQILTTSSNANTYRRTCLNGSWSGWTQDKYTDTNTWRGIQNNLTSDSTDQSLSAAQGKALKTLVDGKAPSVHTHTKSQITDFPTSMPASDVSAWAKAPTKPTYTKAEVGLGNVDNTADKDKNVKYATSAANATNTQYLNNDSQYMRFHWNGQSGQPTWLWGGNDASNMYVYNPSNFSVNYATTAGTALTAKNLPYSITYEGSYVGTAYRDPLYTSDPGGKDYATETNPIKTTLSKEYDVVVFLEAGKKGLWGYDTGVLKEYEKYPEKQAFLRLMKGDLFVKNYVLMGSITNEWVRCFGQIGSHNGYGPVIVRDESAVVSIKYRKNGTTIERYWTRESVGNTNKPGNPTDHLDKGAIYLLDRAGVTYHVFGIDIDHRFFVPAQTAAEGEDTV